MNSNTSNDKPTSNDPKKNPMEKRKQERETKKRENFKNLAKIRTNRAIENIRQIGKLSNEANYSFKSSEVDQIAKVLQKELDAMLALFTESKKPSWDFEEEYD
tara:strand:- start:780 stop:1088 length:309 start_codon:yes stop_codon:yes gene_type:complete